MVRHRVSAACLRLVGVILLAQTAAMAAGAVSTAEAQPAGYCTDQNAVFEGKHPYVGVSDGTIQTERPQLRNCTIGELAAHGIGYYRAEIDWGGAEYAPNTYNWTGSDAVVAAFARHHIHVLFTLIGSPRWLSTDPAADAEGNYPPASPAQFGRFAALCVERYGPNGTFWKENPTLPNYPVEAWQIWNEPNVRGDWLPNPNARAYVDLLKGAYTAIKRADRHATVVTAGMPFYGPSDETGWLTKMYRAGVRGYFDALSIHPYAATLNQAYGHLLVARKVMKHFHNARKALWVTELGFAGGNPDSFISNARKQRSQMTKFFARVQKNRGRLRLQEVMWYGWVDLAIPPGVTYRSWWGYHLGVFTSAFHPKPALASLTAAARRLDR